MYCFSEGIIRFCRSFMVYLYGLINELMNFFEWTKGLSLWKAWHGCVIVMLYLSYTLFYQSVHFSCIMKPFLHEVDCTLLRTVQEWFWKSIALSVFGIFSIQLRFNDSNKFWRIELCPQISWGDNYHQNPIELVVWNELSQNIIPRWSNINLHPLARQAITWNNFITTA